VNKAGETKVYTNPKKSLSGYSNIDTNAVRKPIKSIMYVTLDFGNREKNNKKIYPPYENGKTAH